MTEENRQNVESAAKLLPFWHSLTPSEQAVAVAGSSVRAFDKGEDLPSCMNGCLGLLFVISGCVRVYILSEDGREITLYHVDAGDTCVMSASCVISQLTFDTQIEATEDVRALVMRPEAFKALTDGNVAVECFMYRRLTERFSQVLWVFQQILFFRFDRRLAGYLLEVYGKTGQNPICRTQEEIAREVNSAREVVARMLRVFAREKLLEVNRGKIYLLDIEGLKRFL